MMLSDIELLRRYEPVIYYTEGEAFFPMAVDGYVERCSLWVNQRNQPRYRLWSEGALTLDRLAEKRDFGSEAVTYLKFIEPLHLRELAAYRLRQQSVFKVGRGRLARVGYSARFVDALFSLSLLARGRVSGDTAVAARLAYEEMKPAHQYYGRVVRRDGWMVLQYWYFYAYNNWRSGFYGANDHEADWEMVCLYLSEEASGNPSPEWVAYASHDYSGDDLRRRWDDPEVQKLGDHPVIYAGAGSHASYFQRGEYLTELTLPFMTPVARLVDRVQRRLQADERVARESKWSNFSIFRVPFVDYARGDGRAIGPGHGSVWATPILLAPVPDWVSQYRGLWGLYAQDPFSGEDAPGGPMYNRDGTVRRAWYDPLGWAGLDKVLPLPRQLGQVQQRLLTIGERRTELEATIAQKTAVLHDLGLETVAVANQPHLRPLHRTSLEKMALLSDEIDMLRAKLTEDAALIEALKALADNLQQGRRGPLREHIGHAHTPTTDAGMALSRFAEMWAAASIGLLLIGFVVTWWFVPAYTFLSLGVLLAIFVLIEAVARSWVTNLISVVTIFLALVAATVLVFTFFVELLVMGVLAAGLYVLWENLQELRR